MSNLWRPALFVIRHKNVVTHAESLLKILNFEPEDECNSILVAAFDRISSRKYAKTQFESKTFLTLLIFTRMIYLSENWNNSRCREAFPCSKLTSFCFVCLIIYQTSWNFAQNWLLFVSYVWLFIKRVEILLPITKNVAGMFRHVKRCIWSGVFRKMSA